MENLDFGRGHGRNFDHLTMVILKFWPYDVTHHVTFYTADNDERGSQ